MNLIGEPVKHKTFGKGIITDFTKNKVTVCFDENQKRFLYPDAFSQYLTLQNCTIQRKIDEVNNERLEIIEQKKKREREEYDHRHRLHTMKITERSQVVFNISPKEIQKIMASGLIETGYYLSGKMKGNPRIPSGLQPNSAVLLTGCNENTNEEGRRILGVFMVGEYFWGNECNDGQVKLHKQYKFILKPENTIYFWNYFKQDVIPTRWGKVPFKYFQNQTMQKILLDICKVVSNTEQAQSVDEFYRYFCTMNRLPKIKPTI